MGKLIGETSAICPHCCTSLQKMPGRKTMCPSCQQPILVRTRPQDRQRVLVTPDQALKIADQWNDSAQGGSDAAPRSGRIRTPGGLAALQQERAEWFRKTIREYRSAGVKYVEWLGGDESSCPRCRQCFGKKFPIDRCPTIPVCDDCRCCIAAVVDPW